MSNLEKAKEALKQANYTKFFELWDIEFEKKGKNICDNYHHIYNSLRQEFITGSRDFLFSQRLFVFRPLLKYEKITPSFISNNYSFLRMVSILVPLFLLILFFFIRGFFPCFFWFDDCNCKEISRSKCIDCYNAGNFTVSLKCFEREFFNNPYEIQKENNEKVVSADYYFVETNFDKALTYYKKLNDKNIIELRKTNVEICSLMLNIRSDLSKLEDKNVKNSNQLYSQIITNYYLVNNIEFSEFEGIDKFKNKLQEEIKKILNVAGMGKILFNSKCQRIKNLLIAKNLTNKLICSQRVENDDLIIEFRGNKNFYMLGEYDFQHNPDAKLLADLVAEIYNDFKLLPEKQQFFWLDMQISGASDGHLMPNGKKYVGNNPVKCENNKINTSTSQEVNLEPNQSSIDNSLLGCARAGYFADYLTTSKNVPIRKLKITGREFTEKDGTFRNISIKITFNNLFKNNGSNEVVLCDVCP